MRDNGNVYTCPWYMPEIIEKEIEKYFKYFAFCKGVSNVYAVYDGRAAAIIDYYELNLFGSRWPYRFTNLDAAITWRKEIGLSDRSYAWAERIDAAYTQHQKSLTRLNRINAF